MNDKSFGVQQDSRKLGVGWHGQVQEFLRAIDADLLKALADAADQAKFEVSASQITAWRNSIPVLRSALNSACKSNPEVAAWTLVLEYELPRERGRRPDALLLGRAHILVLEFKDFTEPIPAHIDQVAAYARDLRHYHSECRSKTVSPVLVLTKRSGLLETGSDVIIASGDQLGDVIREIDEPSPRQMLINAEKWIEGEYAPLPSLVSAARRIFMHEPLPAIRRAQSASIDSTLKYLKDLAVEARREGGCHLALITGVPGAGKTLVGLQFVYERHSAHEQEEKQAVFLSGNDPLVKVLQHALRSSVFVQDVHGFLRQYGGGSSQRPREHIWIYDEAQRAWDAERVGTKRGHFTSEPEDFLRIGSHLPEWALMVGLIGEGQEIHLGEEGGIRQWNDAVAATGGKWIVHCPPKLQSTFPAATEVKTSTVLDLSHSLRSHIAEDVQGWVKNLLDGDITRAALLSDRIHSQGFQIYASQNLDDARHYVRELYAGQLDKRYGLLASSKGKNLPAFGVHNDYGFTKNLRAGPWYNDPPDSKYSCCQLRDVATEFACQGLELDLPIVCWGSDLRFDGRQWQIPPIGARNTAKNPRQLRLNSYRVLLSRGRDGVVLYVPNEPQMLATYKAVVAAGARPLVSATAAAVAGSAL